jgi:tetratricopeptide (TPR) repeat protein
LERVKLWWETHQNAYTNWPYAEFLEGADQFSQTHYSSAANFFEQVLKIDPTADMSRALATGCYWEIGDTNKAILLAKDFKNSSGRWAQWAAIKAEMETGKITNATLQLVNLYTNYPTMLGRDLIINKFPIWRKTDWQLFNQNVGQNK